MGNSKILKHKRYREDKVQAECLRSSEALSGSELLGGLLGIFEKRTKMQTYATKVQVILGESKVLWASTKAT